MDRFLSHEKAYFDALPTKPSLGLADGWCVQGFSEYHHTSFQVPLVVPIRLLEKQWHIVFFDKSFNLINCKPQCFQQQDVYLFKVHSLPFSSNSLSG